MPSDPIPWDVWKSEYMATSTAGDRQPEDMFLKMPIDRAQTIFKEMEELREENEILLKLIDDLIDQYEGLRREQMPDALLNVFQYRLTTKKGESNESV